jgi:hypothetical protein
VKDQAWAKETPDLVHVIEAPFGSQISIPPLSDNDKLYTGKEPSLLIQASASRARTRIYSFSGPDAECDDASLPKSRALDPVSKRLLPLVWAPLDHSRIWKCPSYVLKESGRTANSVKVGLCSPKPTQTLLCFSSPENLLRTFGAKKFEVVAEFDRISDTRWEPVPIHKIRDLAAAQRSPRWAKVEETTCGLLTRSG